MGLKESPNIQKNLLDNGMRADMPVAIIENGTRQEQKVFRGGLSDLASLASVATSPALIVVGSVAQLHEKLDWFNKQSSHA